MARLTDPVTILKGVGAVKAKQLENLNIFTLRDLICHFPRGYEDRTKLVPIEKLEVDIPGCFRAMFGLCREVTEEYATGRGAMLMVWQCMLRLFSPMM